MMCISCVYINMKLKISEGGSGLDNVILLSEGGGGGWVLITVDYGEEGGG